MKILILASNPRKDLNLDREIRDLKEVIKKSQNRQAFEVEDALAVKVGQLQELLFDHSPQIVHFCGHGSGQQGLVFEGNDGGEQWVRADALSDLFRLFAENVGCVLLNACYSEEQANAIVNHVDYVIGMNREIRDDAAIAFSKGFYRALGYQCSVEQAYEFGRNAIQLEISGSSKMRSAATEEMVRKLEVVDAIAQVAIPEHLKPILKIKPNQAPSPRANITAPAQPLSQETQTAIHLEIDKSLGVDTKAKQYRDRVREFLGNRKLTKFEEIRLEQLRRNLGLSVEEANRILEEEQKPLQQARDDYQEMLIRLIEEGRYPFTPEIKANLHELRQELQLTDEEVETITKPILEAAEEEYWEKLKQQVDFQLATATVVDGKVSIDHYSGRAEYFVEDLGNGITLEMVAIPGGTFMMGSLNHELNRQDWEGPQHSVTVPPFCMGKFAVTQAQWQTVAALTKVQINLNPDPSKFKGPKRPVERVSWHEAVEFCDRLSQKTGRQYRLPSEAEWEYACHAGTQTPFYVGETITPDLANYDGNHTYGAGSQGVYRKRTTDVGTFPPNAFGLYDMHGNVWEWCLDHWHENYQGAPADGTAWVTDGNSDKRLMRGGSWYRDPGFCRSAARDYFSPGGQYFYLGFRVVCVFA